jgi:hypothetical protein
LFDYSSEAVRQVKVRGDREQTAHLQTALVRIAARAQIRTAQPFDAADKNGKSEELRQELETLFESQNKSQNKSQTAGATSIPATFLRVTVLVK